MLKNILGVACFACITFSAWAQPGSLDLTFGDNGISLLLPQPVFNKGYSVLVQGDNKILFAGYSLSGSANVITLARLLPTGDPDLTFGNNGTVETSVGAGASCYAGALQPDGKILLAGSAVSALNGSSDFAVLRYLPNGTLDSTFSDDGIQTISFATGDDQARAITLQPDGKILLAGTSTNGNGALLAIARLNSNGVLDSSFSGDGKATLGIGTIFTNGYAVALQPDGKILLAGAAKFGMADDVALARFLPNGTPDPSFGVAGHLHTDLGSDADSGNALAILPDGKILVAGITGDDRDFALLRYSSAGVLDQSFGNQGFVTTDFLGSDDYANGILLRPDGKITLGGYSYNGSFPDFALAQYLPNGSLDTDFGDNGVTTTDFGNAYDYGFPIAYQPDGKILLGGYSFSNGHTSFALARYVSGWNVGVVDFSYVQSALIAPNPVLDQTMFEFETLEPSALTLSLLDVQGHLIKNYFTDKKFGAGKQQELLHFQADLPSGMYFLQLENGKGQMTLKILKK